MSSSAHDQLAQPDGRTVFRRRHVKADGRSLLLYGYAPHTADPLPGGLEGAGPGAHLRYHPLLQEWSVYAAHRQNRTFQPSRAADPLAPSRPGEAVTEVEFENFEVAVFQNRFASLHPAAGAAHSLPPGIAGRPADGDCEVVVFDPGHEGTLGTLSQERRRLLVSAWNDRYAAHFANGAAFVMPFESRGEEVGVTLSHPHGQIYAFPFVPDVQAKAARAFSAGYDLAGAVREWDTYVVEEAGPMVAVVPPFARYPFEVWIVPREPVPGPWALSAEAFDAYAHLLGAVTRRYDAAFGRATPTMMSLQAAPRGEEGRFQFWTQFFCILRAKDRLKYLATVEQATGVFTVDVMPEAAAQILREAS